MLYVDAPNEQFHERFDVTAMPVEAFGGEASTGMGGGCGARIVVVPMRYGEAADPIYTTVRSISDELNVVCRFGWLPVGAITYGLHHPPFTSCVQTTPFDADHASVMSPALEVVYR